MAEVYGRIMVRTCRKCKTLKERISYTISPRYCNDCMTNKICRICNIRKPIIEFSYGQTSQNCNSCKKYLRSSRAKYWKENNRERYNELRRAWKKRNSHKVALINKSYSAKRRGAKGSYLSSDIIDIHKRQNGLCVYCETILNERFHVDHIIPIKLGGENNKHNLQILCSQCNVRKSSYNPLSYERKIGFERKPIIDGSYIYVIMNEDFPIWKRGKITEAEFW